MGKNKDKGLSPSFVEALKQTIRCEPEETPKTISDILEEMAGDICDNYCKYADIYAEDECDFLYDKICSKCPLTRWI